MTGGFAKSGSFTGRDFSGGSTRVGLPVLGFASEVDLVVVSGASEVWGLGVAEAGAADWLLSLADVVDCVADVDWARDKGEKEKTKAAASTRGFIVLESLLGLSQNYGTSSHDKDVTRSAGVNSSC